MKATASHEGGGTACAWEARVSCGLEESGREPGFGAVPAQKRTGAQLNRPAETHRAGSAPLLQRRRAQRGPGQRLRQPKVALPLTPLSLAASREVREASATMLVDLRSHSCHPRLRSRPNVVAEVWQLPPILRAQVSAPTSSRGRGHGAPPSASNPSYTRIR